MWVIVNYSDIKDLKSLGVNSLPVRFRPRAAAKLVTTSAHGWVELIPVTAQRDRLVDADGVRLAGARYRAIFVEIDALAILVAHEFGPF